MAEDNALDNIEKIEVISHKQAYRGNVSIKELPQAVKVISTEKLTGMGISNFQTALSLDSSLARQNNFGGLWESFAIRGFSGDENLPSAYLINGFSAGRGYSGLRDTSNIEAIEVLKGPASALYGRGEPGGTVNIITKKPQFDQQGYITLTAGEDAYQRFEGDYTNGISDNIAFRINGAHETSDSFRHTVESQKTALTPSIFAKLSDSTTLTYELEYVDQEIPFDRGIPVLPGVDIPKENFFGEPSDGPMNVDAMGHQLSLQHQINTDWSVSFGAGYRDSSLEGYSSEIELSPGRQLLYVDGETVSRQRRFRDYDAKDASLRAELSGFFSAFGAQHNVLIGADGYDYELHSIQERWRTAWGSGDATYSINAYNPVYGQTAPATSPTQDNLEKQKAFGLYLQDQMALTQRVNLLVGVRFDEFEQDLINNFNGTLVSQSKSEVNPRIGVSYDMDNGVSIYSNYAEGFRPNTGADVNNNAFEPEKSESIEAGVKWSVFNEAFSGTLAVFKTEKSNILTADPVNSGFSTALGEAQSSGIELDSQFNITDNTVLDVSYTYIDAHTLNDMTNPDWGVDIPANSQLINVPKHTLNMSLTHFTELADKNVLFGGHVLSVSERLGETIDPTYKLPSYTIVNLFGTLDINDKVTLQASVENLFDEDYFANSYSALWTMPGQPRRVKASISYIF
ncbi:TonB-dependent siderophore receptor [Thalassotalea sp. PLHSN55]|uniref:TonB-dependent siderophore receptor n=1 Tax=Thalassotalea sp. PLHSN55 TaxID=3435888 RepID=UPI003F8708AB